MTSSEDLNSTDATQRLDAGPTRSRRPAALSARVRILGSYIALLGLALVLGLILQRGLLVARLNEEVNAELRQEVEELRQLSLGRDPETGRPFGGDAAAIFETHLRQNIPVQGQALFTMVDGRPHASTVTPVQLLDDPAVVGVWAAARQPARGQLRSTAGDVRYLAVPILDGERVAGVFVAAIFLRERSEELDRLLQLSGAAYASVFAAASVFAWVVAGRVLRPVRLLTETARAISENSWTGRIPIQGQDEIAELGRTFNEMLDRLEAAFAAQRRFIDDASHELRTPITIIRGQLEVMGSDPEERREVLRLVTDELGRMSRIVDDLLLLAVAEQPDFLDLHPIDAAELTEEILAKAVALSPSRAWRLDVVARVVVMADPQRLTQAVMNLARNAVEHSPAGSAITLGSEQSGDRVRFWVRDEGEGVPPAERERIFERFARGGRARRSEGAGLGLSIVKTIAEAHGGTVSYEPREGGGSSFVIDIPMSWPAAAH